MQRVGAEDHAARRQAEVDRAIASLQRLAQRRSAEPTREPGCIREDLVLIRRTIDALELEFSACAAELDACDEDEWQGAPSASSWISDRCHTTGRSAWNAVVVGAHSAPLTASAEDLRSGRIGFAHLACIAQTRQWAEESGCADSIDEMFLLHRARQGTVAQLQRDCAHLRHALDPRRFLREQQLQREERFLVLKGCEGGGLFLRGYLDIEGGVTLRTALEPLARPLPDDERSRDRRLADSLVELSAMVLDGGTLPQHAGQRPHLQVTVSLPTMQGQSGAPAGELELGGAIAAETARRLGCDATIRRIIFGPESQILDVGSATRTPQPATRSAVVARDRGCVWPGCGRPASWGEVHHLRHWTHGGGTDLHNLVLICRAHHWRVHEGGWQLLPSRGGFLAVAPVPKDLAPPQSRAPDP
jgi:hypothetical protein